jgi:hypothetical protein
MSYLETEPRKHQSVCIDRRVQSKLEETQPNLHQSQIRIMRLFKSKSYFYLKEKEHGAKMLTQRYPSRIKTKHTCNYTNKFGI